MRKTRQYNIWNNMKMRCLNPRNKKYNIYGARGITVCDKWLSFSGFWEDMSEGYDDSLTLERIDSDSNYEKSNCKWATYSEQNYNTRIKKTNSSGKTGVSFDLKSNKWRSYIDFKKKRIELGRFDDYMEALIARIKAEVLYYGKIKN